MVRFHHSFALFLKPFSSFQFNWIWLSSYRGLTSFPMYNNLFAEFYQSLLDYPNLYTGYSVTMRTKAALFFMMTFLYASGWASRSSHLLIRTCVLGNINVPSTSGRIQESINRPVSTRYYFHLRVQRSRRRWWPKGQRVRRCFRPLRHGNEPRLEPEVLCVIVSSGAIQPINTKNHCCYRQHVHTAATHPDTYGHRLQWGWHHSSLPLIWDESID